MCDVGGSHGVEVFRNVTVDRALSGYGRFGGAYWLQLYSLAVGSTVLLNFGNRLTATLHSIQEDLNLYGSAIDRLFERVSLFPSWFKDRYCTYIHNLV